MSKDRFSYALFTMQTGCRPILSLIDIFRRITNSLVPQLDAIENESGTTYRKGLEIALSNTAILMTYSLVEGFFFEEHQFYFEKAPPRGQSLEKTIRSLLSHIDIPDNEHINERISRINVLYAARNAIVHRNGQLKEKEKLEIQNLFGSAMDIRHGYPVADISLIFENFYFASDFISEFSDAAVKAATTAQQSTQADGITFSAPTT